MHSNLAPPPRAEPATSDPVVCRERLVEDLLNQLTLDEKISLVHGNTKFSTAGVPRLGIAERWLTDGPHGVREEISPHSWESAGWSDDYATALPISLALAAAWNPALALTGGEVLGSEARARRKDILLAPGVNIQRTPLCGRTFEYFGEDPFLAGKIAVSYIRGVQSQGVAACVKHLAVNNQETDRGTIDVKIDERALREIYLPAFQAAVQEGGVWAVMGAYNKLRGQWCSHNDDLLNRILKGEWGFQGLVVSDWNAVHDTDEAVFNGLDLEMGTDGAYEDYFLATPFHAGILAGRYPMEALDEKVRRNLRVLIATGGFGHPDARLPGALAAPAHRAVACAIAEESIVLLKNEPATLPIPPGTVRSIAVIGENATRCHARGGFGAGVKVTHEITPLEGVTRRVGPHTAITYSPGYSATIHHDGDLVEHAVQAARSADVAVVFAGLGRAPYLDDESTDRASLALPFGQDELIRRVSEANPRTVLVMISGSPVVMDAWLASVPAVLQAWYGGMEAGTAIARVIFGDVAPSGKLPCTFPRRLEDVAAHATGPAAYPGVGGVVDYEEGLLVGYRHFDTRSIEPLFPFGHGLSYTTFEYARLELRTGGAGFLDVSFDLVNTGACRGAEVAQLYVHDVESSLPRPFRELKGFSKVLLDPGESARVSIPLDLRAFMFFHPERSGWLAERGDFQVMIGSSSRDVRLVGKFHLDVSRFEPLPVVAAGQPAGDAAAPPVPCGANG